jgi:hypothetical protein
VYPAYKQAPCPGSRLIRRGEEILASREDRSSDLRHQVERIIAKLLCRGEAETEAVATSLG